MVWLIRFLDFQKSERIRNSKTRRVLMQRLSWATSPFGLPLLTFRACSSTFYFHYFEMFCNWSVLWQTRQSSHSQQHPRNSKRLETISKPADTQNKKTFHISPPERSFFIRFYFHLIMVADANLTQEWCEAFIIFYISCFSFLFPRKLLTRFTKVLSFTSLFRACSGREVFLYFHSRINPKLWFMKFLLHGSGLEALTCFNCCAFWR